jgi:ectoine hydroxylase-related dioxygenase (phytanoyl-CoA dioxygenase family)
MSFYTPPQIKQGDLIIFPSFLNHYVKPNTSEKQRITITFNVAME